MNRNKERQGSASGATRLHWSGNSVEDGGVRHRLEERFVLRPKKAEAQAAHSQVLTSRVRSSLNRKNKEGVASERLAQGFLFERAKMCVGKKKSGEGGITHKSLKHFEEE